MLRPLAQTLQERGVPVQHAIFAPADSSYMSLAKGGSQDTTWQQALRDMWQSDFASAGSLKVGIHIWLTVPKQGERSQSDILTTSHLNLITESCRRAEVRRL